MMSAASFKRCRHIITENARVLEAREALLRGDMKHFGTLMVEAHVSLRDDFAASCEEVDMLVAIAHAAGGVFWCADYWRWIWRLHGECRRRGGGVKRLLPRCGESMRRRRGSMRTALCVRLRMGHLRWRRRAVWQ